VTTTRPADDPLASSHFCRTPAKQVSRSTTQPKGNDTMTTTKPRTFKVTINPHIVADKYPLPRFEEIASKLNGCNVFSVINLKDAYLQLPVAEQSRKYFTIVTHRGYLRYSRLPFGVNFAPSLFQSTLDKILSGIR
jgi:hypothetical protein